MHGCGCFSLLRHDPGPCPVDDTPHTACTPESVAGQISAPSRRPRVLDAMDHSVGPEFSTKEYKRAIHGRKRKV